MKSLISILLIASFQISNGQTLKDNDSTFSRISRQIEYFKIDTSSPPADKTTKLVIRLRSLRGGFNINEAIRYKLQEDFQKKEISQHQYDLYKEYFETGTGKRSIDHAITWIYRNTFTKNELKKLVKFYKTKTGKKFSETFPVIMLQSLMAAQILKDQFKLPTK
jgi:hypothetical protein